MDTSPVTKAPLQESRAFISQAYTVWASLQKIVEEYESTAPTSGFRLGRNIPEPPPPEQVQYYGRVARLYRETIAKQLPLVKSDPTLTPQQKSTTLSHYATMHSILALAEILYFPSDGKGEGLVGEELLDWVNTVDRAPSAEEGALLSQLSTPWDSPTFFPYLTRCLLRGHLSSASALLSLLSTTHPSPFLQSAGKFLTDLVSTYPRSTSFRTEPAFLSALRAWKSNLSASTRSLQTLFSPSSSAADPVLDADEKSEWTTFLSSLLSILSGSESTILDLSEEWREALSAWGLWVNPGSFRREDLPTLVQEVVTKELPVDGTLMEEVAMEKLLTGDAAGVLKALTGGGWAWLATHLADLLSHLHLPAFDPPSTSTTDRLLTEEGDKEAAELPLGLREHFLLDYAERLTVDEGLWRVSCEYWGACGEEGRKRARALLKGLRLDDPVELAAEGEREGEGAMDVEGEEKEGEGKKEGKGRKTKRVEEVLRVCADLGLEEEMVEICQSYAAHLTSLHRYGEAIAFSVRAADSRRIAEIAELILEAYVTEGQDAFINHVDSIPTSLLRPISSSSTSAPSSPTSSTFSSLDNDDDEDLFPSAPSSALTPYSSTLSFLARYRDFFALYSRDGGVHRGEAAKLLVLLLTSGVCPPGWRAVGLLDCLGVVETSPPLISLSETYDLLRILEDVVGPVVSQSPPVDVSGHLDALGRLTEARGEKGEKAKKGQDKGKGEEEKKRERTQRALEQMEVVRGALARHLALCCCLE